MNCTVCGGLAEYKVLGPNGKQVLCDACLPDDVLVIEEDHAWGSHPSHQQDQAATAGHAA